MIFGAEAPARKTGVNACVSTATEVRFVLRIALYRARISEKVSEGGGRMGPLMPALLTRTVRKSQC